MQENKLKAALARGEMQFGTWLNLMSPDAAEMAGAAGFDWCLIDAEHAPYDVPAIMTQLRALAPHNTSAVVRVPVGEVWIIKQVLDLGVQSLVVPMIDTAEQAAEMVAATRYAPRGIRGMGAALARASQYGVDTDYIANADTQICLLVQAETRLSLENLDAILAVDGVDGVFIGPSDLSADMGFPGNPDAPEVRAAIKDAVAKIRAAGKAAGFYQYDASNMAYSKEIGVNFMCVCADASLLRAAFHNAVADARKALD